ncbi:MAG TPA: hypothetical protein VGS80_26725, partial [Ktedonobacterales bacterium]|nr:hypothetical protein [Ktedonobacterales bacterium]
SNPNWPGGFPPQEGTSQQADPSKPSYPSSPPQQGNEQQPGQFGQPGVPGYPPSGYPPSGYPPSGYPPSGYPPSGYPQAPYPYGPYGQPAAPSQPLYPYGQPGTTEGMTGQPGTFGQPGIGEPTLPSYPPYGQPAMPSQPLYPYGQPAAPSQPLYPYGMPGQYGPPSQGFPGPMTVAAPKKSYRGLWIGLVIALLVLGTLSGGGVFAFSQYQAPANAAVQFCDALRNANYVTAYAMFSSGLQAQYQQTEFAQGAQMLDTLEGHVTACKQATGNAYSYTLFASTATVQSVITRGTAGDLKGALRLKDEGGTWKVDGIDTALLGANLGALQAVVGFCAAMQSKDYTTAYGFFGSSVQAQISQTTFQSNTGLWDQVDGPVNTCSAQALGTPNTDTGATLTIALMRAKKSAVTASVALDVEGSAWKFTTIDQTVLGSDLGPLSVGNKFCADLAANNYKAAYGLVSTGFKAHVSLSQFQNLFVVPGITVKWSCSPNLDTYQVTGSDGTYDMTMKATDTATGQSASVVLTFYLVQEGTAWKVAGWKNK